MIQKPHRSDMIRRGFGGILALVLLAGVSPLAYAQPETELPPEEMVIEEHLPEEQPAVEVPEEEPTAPESVPDKIPPAGDPAALSDTVVTYPVTGGNIYFDTATGTITRCDYSVTVAEIPSVINGNSVTTIGESAFADCNSLTSVTIPDSVMTIGDYAFLRCRLTSVTIPDSVTTIGEHAFADCNSLTNVTIPDSVTTIKEFAFTGCRRLTGIYVSEGNTTYSSIDGVLFDKSQNILIIYPGGKSGEYTIPSSVTTIGEWAFAICSSLTSVTIGNSVTTIGDYAFLRCSLTSVAISDSVTSVGGYAFSECKSLTSVTIGSSVTTIGGSVTTIEESAFVYCSSLTSVTIGNSVTAIGAFAFYSCRSLTSMAIPDSVTTIGNAAFAYCSSLTGVTIGNSVTTIGGGAFAECYSLTNVTIPDSVTTIGNYAFVYCSSLISVTIGNSVTMIGDRAFDNCRNLTSIIFRGDAPNATSAESSSRSFPINATLYYIAGKAGWTTPTWEGYKTAPILGGGGQAESHTENYYSKIHNYFFCFTEYTGVPLTGVTLALAGQSVSSEGTSELSVAYSGTDLAEMVTISKPGYHSVTLPLYVLGNQNKISLYPDTHSSPYAAAVYGTQDGGKSYRELINSGMKFYAGSLTEKTGFYISVNWGNQSAGKIYLSQTMYPEDGIELREGLNDARNVSLYLKSSGSLYLLMQTQDGTVYPDELKATILKENANFEVDLGDSVSIPSKGDPFLSKLKLGMELPGNLKITTSIESDGTVKAALGVQVTEDKDVNTVVDTIKDALYYADNYPKDWDSFIGALKGSIIPQSTSFVVSAKSEAIGYLEGKLIRREDGSYDILVYDAKIAYKITGKVKNTMQIYPMGIPVYVGGSVEPSVEFSVGLWSNEKNILILDPVELEGKLPIKLRGGLGWDSIASAGIYGKGEITVEHKIPGKKEDLKVYVNASFGAEAKVFCFSADIKIYETKDFYLYGSKEDALRAMAQYAQLTAGAIDWKPQSRSYLYQPSLMAAGAGEHTVFSGVYPYTDVQLAALSGGKQLMVWTADPGEAARAEANNRTRLYCACFDGTQWSVPSPVELTDDGTGDFNPVLKVLDGTAYLVWQDASRPLTGGDSAEATAKVMDISVAEFNEDSETFTALGSVGTENYDGAASIGKKDGALTVVWASNSGENPLAADGQVGTLHRAVWNGTDWTTEVLAEDLGAIDQTATDGARIWFSADTDYDADTVADREIFLYDGSISQLTNNDTADTKPSYLNGSVLWYQDGSIVSQQGAVISLAEDTDRYCYVRGGDGMEAVVYTVTDASRISALYASFYDGTSWGEPVSVTQGEGNIGSFSAQFLSDGTLSVVTSERVAAAVTDPYDVPVLAPAADIKAYAVAPLCDLALKQVTYLPHSMVPNGTLDVQADLQNTGMMGVKLLNIAVKDQSGTVMLEQAMAADLRSGESRTVTVGVPLGAVLPEQLTVEVMPLDYSDTNTTDNTGALALRLADVSLEGAVATSDGDGTKVTVFVVNRGQTELVNVTLTASGADGTFLGSATVPSLPVGTSQFVEIQIAGALTDNSLVTVTASGVVDENLTSNNSCTALIAGAPKAEISLSASCVDRENSTAVMAAVRNTTDTDQTYRLYCASYDSSGKLLAAAASDELTVRSGEEAISQLALTSHPTAAGVKVFLLDPAYAPLTSRVEIPLG